MSLAAGTRLGGLEIVALLGAGGMGEVYRARDTRLDRHVAVKILPDAVARDPESRARFEREARTLAALSHPNIAQVHGFEESATTTIDGVPVHALVMELVEGEDLAQRLVRGPLPLDDLLAIARQIAEALEAAHGLGIVHRDLKPANIRIRPDGLVKLLDFGLAKPIWQATPAKAWQATPEKGSPLQEDLENSPTITSPAMTARGIILGTAAYMAPEQARGKPVDKRADVWAFGVVLYEMLCRRRPFAGDDVTEVISQVLQREPDWNALPPATPASIRRLLRRCLEKNQKRRLRDCGDALLDLDAATEGPAAALTPPPAQGVRGWIVPALAGAAIGALTLGLGTTLRAPRQPERQVHAGRFAVVGAGDRMSGAGRPAIAISRDGRRIVVAANDRLMLRSPGELALRPIPGTERVPVPAGLRGNTGIAVSPFFSFDGEQVAYHQAGQLKRIAIAGGAPAVICTCPAPSGATWNEDDSILLAWGIFSGRAGGIARVAARGGEPERLIAAEPGQSVLTPQLLPDGDHLLFSITTGEHWSEADVVVQSLRSGVRRVLVKGAVDGRYAPTGHLVFGRNGSLHAVAFDVTRLETVGNPVPVLSEVAQSTTSGGWGGMSFAMADNGSAIYTPAAAAAIRRVPAWIDRSGREEPLSLEPRAYQYPRFSPDGQRVVFDLRDRLNDVWYWDLTRTTLAKVTDGRYAGGPALWSADGQSVIFGPDVGGEINLHLQRVSGGPPQRLMQSPNTQFADDLTPDGRSLVFAEWDSANASDLRLLPLDPAGQPRDLIRTPSNEYNADISPDGRWIAYQSDESGRFEVYVRPFPQVNDGRWPVSVNGGTRPLWSRDGRELFFLDESRRMSVVEVRAGSRLTLGQPKTLFDTSSLGLEGQQRNYDLSPDGKRFLMVRNLPPPADVPLVVLIQGWFDELRAAAR